MPTHKRKPLLRVVQRYPGKKHSRSVTTLASDKLIEIRLELMFLSSLVTQETARFTVSSDSR
jgi:hypothetical protein